MGATVVGRSGRFVELGSARLKSRSALGKYETGRGGGGVVMAGCGVGSMQVQRRCGCYRKGMGDDFLS